MFSRASYFMFLPLITRKINSFSRLRPFEKAWLLPAWFLLGLCRLLVLLIPFRLISAHLGAPYGTVAWVPVLDAREEVMAHAISRIIQSAARNTPWKSNCFPQAIAARVLLGLYGVPYTLFFGVSHDASGAELNAHAWVTAGRVRVSGGGSFGQFTVLACFASHRIDFFG